MYDFNDCPISDEQLAQHTYFVPEEVRHRKPTYTTVSQSPPERMYWSDYVVMWAAIASCFVVPWVVWVLICWLLSLLWR